MDRSGLCTVWLERSRSDERPYCALALICRLHRSCAPSTAATLSIIPRLDNLTEVVTPQVCRGYTALQRSLELLENNEVLRVQVLCEPQMGKRGLYPTLSLPKAVVSRCGR